MSNEFAQAEDQYLEQMANGGSSDRALEADYLEQENLKEQSFSDQENREKSNHKPYYQQQVEQLFDAVKSGQAPFLLQDGSVGSDGKVKSAGNYIQNGDSIIITPRPAVRMLSGKPLVGVNQLTAQIALNQMGSKSQTVMTFEQAKNEGAFIRKGSKSFVITGYDKDAGEGESKSKVYHVFSAGVVSNSDSIKEILAKNANANAPKPWTKEVINITDGTPEKFLGAYLAASATGAKLETDRQTVSQFQQQFSKLMEQSISEKQHTAVFEVGRNAQKYSTEIRQDSYNQWNKNQQREHSTNTKDVQAKNKDMDMGMVF